MRVAVLDSPSCSAAVVSSPAAGILVPRGRESDWLFSTAAGHVQLLLSTDTHRLVLIGRPPLSDSPPALYVPPPERRDLHRRLVPLLRPLLLALSPRSAFEGRTLLPEPPFLCYDDGLERIELAEVAVGPVVGEMLVEDVEDGGGLRERRRRLRFKRMPNLVQTQMRLLPDSALVVETGVLVQPYLAAMVAGLLLLLPGGQTPRRRALCLGVGGGALLTFLERRLGFEVVGVEADEVVLAVAKRHFGLVEGEFLKVTVGDAISALHDLSSESCPDAIMVDLDSQDPETGAVAPPPEFVTEEVIARARAVLQPREGVLVINVIPPMGRFLDGTLLGYLREEFSELYRIDVGNGENVVLLAAFPNQHRGSWMTHWRLEETLRQVLGDDTYARTIKRV